MAYRRAPLSLTPQPNRRWCGSPATHSLCTFISLSLRTGINPGSMWPVQSGQTGFSRTVLPSYPSISPSHSCPDNAPAEPPFHCCAQPTGSASVAYRLERGNGLTIEHDNASNIHQERSCVSLLARGQTNPRCCDGRATSIAGGDQRHHPGCYGNRAAGIYRETAANRHSRCIWCSSLHRRRSRSIRVLPSSAMRAASWATRTRSRCPTAAAARPWSDCACVDRLRSYRCAWLLRRIGR